MPDWTVETLHAYLSHRLDSLDREVARRDDAARSEFQEWHRLLAQIMDERHDASQREFDRYDSETKTAIIKSEQDYVRRFESVNEFRAQLNDQVATFLPRSEYEVAHSALVRQVSDLNDRMNLSQGRGVGLQSGWAYLLGAAALVGVVVAAIAAFK